MSTPARKPGVSTGTVGLVSVGSPSPHNDHAHATADLTPDPFTDWLVANRGALKAHLGRFVVFSPSEGLVAVGDDPAKLMEGRTNGTYMLEFVSEFRYGGDA